MSEVCESKLARACRTQARAFASSMLNGSSSSRARGFSANAAAMHTRCFCPPDNVERLRYRRCSIPHASSACVTRALISSGRIAVLQSANATSSSTVEVTKLASGSWPTYAKSKRMAEDSTSAFKGSSSKATEPSSKSIVPKRTRSSVDFPEPFGPTRAILPACGTSKFTFVS